MYVRKFQRRGLKNIGRGLNKAFCSPFQWQGGSNSSNNIFTDLGQGYCEEIHQTSPGPEAHGRQGLSILRALSEIHSLIIKEITCVSGPP